MSWVTAATIGVENYGNVYLQYDDSSTSGNSRSCQVIFRLNSGMYISVNFLNFTVDGVNYGSKSVTGNTTLWSGTLSSGNRTVSWSCNWYDIGSRSYSGTGNIPGSSTPNPPSNTPPTGLSVRLGNVYNDRATFSVAVSSFGTPSNATGRFIGAIVSQSSPVAEPWMFATITNTSSGSVTVRGLTANTRYYYAGYAGNTVMQSRVQGNAPFTTLCNAPTVSLSHQSYTSSTTVQAEISYRLSSDGGALPRTLYYQYSTNGGSSYSSWTSLGSSTSGVITLDLPTDKSVKVVAKATTSAGEMTSNTCSFRTLDTHTPPTFKNFTYKDTNAATVKLTGNDQTMIQGQSKPSVTIPVADKATWSSDVAVTNYSISFCDSSKSVSYSSSADVTATLPAPTASGTCALRVAAVDSMTGSTAVTKNVTVYPWAAPTISAVFERPLGEETGVECSLRIKGAYSSLQIGGTAKNTLTVSYRLKPSSEEWGGTNTKSGTREVTINGDSWTTTDYVLALDNNQWDAEVTAQDIFTTTKVSLKLTSGVPRFFIGSDGRVGIGKKPDVNMGSSQGQLEVDGNVYAKNLYLGGKQPLMELSKTDILNMVYPIGSIYMSMNDTSPQSFLGGTWERIAEGRTLVGVASGDSDFGTVNRSGGSKTVTLTTDQIPEHSHTRGTMEISGWFRHKGWDEGTPDVSGVFSSGGTAYNAYGGHGAKDSQIHAVDFTASKNWTGSTSSVGGGQAHSNLQPYLTCYIWRRTA